MIYVIDLFCGCGGFSQGSLQAGCRPLLAIDNWQEALDVHAQNHPDCVHWKCDLGGDVNEFVFSVQAFLDLYLPPGGHVHVHASPPCQSLSLANKKRNDSGFFLVEWALEVIQLLAPRTWSLENVAHPELARRYDTCKTYVMSEYGVPQNRRRAIMTNFDTTDMAREVPPCVIDIVSHTRPEVDWVNCEMTSSGCLWKIFRPLTGLSYTVLARPPMVRHRISGKRFSLSVTEAALIQTFPESYKFPSTAFSYRVIGNAVPPRFAQHLMNCVATS